MKLCIEQVCGTFLQHEEELNELDREGGDGDCGATFKRWALGWCSPYTHLPSPSLLLRFHITHNLVPPPPPPPFLLPCRGEAAAGIHRLGFPPKGLVGTGRMCRATDGRHLWSCEGPCVSDVLICLFVCCVWVESMCGAPLQLYTVFLTAAAGALLDPQLPLSWAKALERGTEVVMV